MLNEIGIQMREALLDEYDAVTDPTHRLVIDQALAHVAGYQPRGTGEATNTLARLGYATSRDVWIGDRMPPIVRANGRSWFLRCCGERLSLFQVTEQRITPTGVIKPGHTYDVTICRVCGERS